MSKVTSIFDQLREVDLGRSDEVVGLLQAAKAHESPRVRAQLAVRLAHAGAAERWGIAFSAWAQRRDTLHALAQGFPVGGLTFDGLVLAGVSTRHGEHLARAVVARLEPGTVQVVVGWWPELEADRVGTDSGRFQVPEDPLGFAELLPVPAAGALAEVLDNQLAASDELGAARLLEHVVAAVPACLALEPQGS